MAGHNCTGLTSIPTALIPNTCAIPLVADDARAAIRSCCGAAAPVVEWVASADQTCRLSCPAADQTVNQLATCLQAVDRVDTPAITCSGAATARASLDDIVLAHRHANQNAGWCAHCALDVLTQDGALDRAAGPLAIPQALLAPEQSLGPSTSPPSSVSRVERAPSDDDDETPSGASALGLGGKERRNKDRILAAAIALILVGSAMGTFC